MFISAKSCWYCCLLIGCFFCPRTSLLQGSNVDNIYQDFSQTQNDQTKIAVCLQIVQSLNMQGGVQDSVVNYLTLAAASARDHSSNKQLDQPENPSLLSHPLLLQNSRQQRREQAQESSLKVGHFLRKNLLHPLALACLFSLAVLYFFCGQQRAHQELRRLSKEMQEQQFIFEQHQHELVSAQAQAIQAEKMTSLGQMASGIAHQIKNPLNFVNNFAHNLCELATEIQEEIQGMKSAMEEQAYQDIADKLYMMQHGSAFIETNGKRADQIVSSMMQHNRTTAAERRLVDLNQLLTESVEKAYHQYLSQGWQEEIQFFQSSDSFLPAVSVQPKELSQALVNIINNACEAIGERRGEKAFLPAIQVGTELGEEEMIIRIKDNGKGIGEDIQNKLFDPFFTTKPTDQGNIGLGLSIAYDTIVHGHQGNIELHSQPGVGTEFVIRLPWEQ